MPDDVPVAESKSAIDRMRGSAYGGRRRTGFSGPEGFMIRNLETERKETQDEISKLTVMLSDADIPMDDAEIMGVNEEINRLLEIKSKIEMDLSQLTKGELRFAVGGSASQFKYFGRAKDIRVKREEADRLRKEGEKRKVFEISHVSETDKELIVQESIGNAGARTKANAKKTRFDSDSSDSS